MWGALRCYSAPVGVQGIGKQGFSFSLDRRQRAVLQHMLGVNRASLSLDRRPAHVGCQQGFSLTRSPPSTCWMSTELLTQSPATGSVTAHVGVSTGLLSLTRSPATGSVAAHVGCFRAKKKYDTPSYPDRNLVLVR